MSSAIRRLGWMAAAAVALLVVAGACSSTERLGTVTGASSATPAGSEVPGASGGNQTSAGPPGANPTTVPGAGGSAPVRSSGSSATPTGTRTEQVAGRTLTVSHGVSNGHIQIGIAWVDAAQANAGFKALAGQGAKIGDSKAQAQAVVDYVNAHGGIAGLTVDPVYYQFSASNLVTPSGRAQETQAECAAWTQDHHVFAILVVLSPADNMSTCAANTQTPLISAGFGQRADDVQFAKMANLLYFPAAVTIDQREKLVVDRMVQSGVLTPKSKVGVLIEGNSAMFKRAADRTLIPDLQRNHVPIASQIVYPDFIEAPWDSYVLQFRQAGVDTVYLGASEGGGWSALFFTRAASNQKWYPKYVMSSDLSVAGIGTIAAPDQAPGIHGAGWLPEADTGDLTALTANGTLCKQIMNSVGQPDYDALNMGIGYCETLFFLQSALAGSTNITPAGIAAGATALGTRFGSILTRTTNFGGGVHYAANTVQDFAYDPACKCMAYVGNPASLR